MDYLPSNSNVTNINSLPDELILKIVELAASGGGQGEGCNHNFILNVISKISKRFKRISTDPSLWRGNVTINASQQDTRLAIRESINNGTTFLKIRLSSGGNISSGDLIDINKRCTNLKGLDVLFDLGSWPKYPSIIAWKSMKVLILHLTRDVDPIDFWDGDMDSYLPNLLEFTICSPKMHYTTSLEEVSAYLKPEVKLPEQLQEIVQFKGIYMSLKSFKHGIRRSHQCKGRFEMLKDGKILELASRRDSLRKLAKIVYEVSMCRNKRSLIGKYKPRI